MLQSFFFNKKSTAAPAPPAAAAAAAAAAARSAAAAAAAREGNGNGLRHGVAGGNGTRESVRPSRFGNGVAGPGVDEETYRLIEGAVPTEFAGRSWEGYLHHVDFIVALMHVGTSLIPKSLMKVRGPGPTKSKRLAL